MKTDIEVAVWGLTRRPQTSVGEVSRAKDGCVGKESGERGGRTDRQEMHTGGLGAPIIR